MKNLMEKMIERPFSTVLVVSVVVNGVSVLAHNLSVIIKK